MELDGLRAKKTNLESRARLFAALRRIFTDDGFLEVETAVRIAAPAPEEFIESIPAGGEFLRCSPELAMKELLAAGFEKIFQLGPCFRAGEHGRKHREEFAMLEYYAANWSYRALLDFTAGFIRQAAQELFGRPELSYQGARLDLAAPPEIVSVADAFARYAGISAAEAEARECFDELMVTKIEPELGRDRLAFLIDYPANRSSLARLKPEEPACCERWELYLAGIELANGYGELTDPAEQRARFEAAAHYRAAHGMLAYPEPAGFYAALAAGLPSCSGAALGLDRLAMIFTDAADIAQVRVE